MKEKDYKFIHNNTEDSGECGDCSFLNKKGNCTIDGAKYPWTEKCWQDDGYWKKYLNNKKQKI